MRAGNRARGPSPADAARAWDAATAHLPAPLVAVDLDAFDANAADLARRAAGRPIRVASKSVRCRTLLERALAAPGFAGVMAYAVREAVWLAEAGAADVFVAYPSVDAEAVATVAGREDLRTAVTLAVDSIEHVDWLRSRLGPATAGLQVALDVDASVRIGRLHAGVRRSPTRTPAQALAVVRAAQEAGLVVRGLMFYDAQVAGLPDAGPHVRLLKRRSRAELARRRTEVVGAVRAVADLAFVNAGGTGSLHTFGRGEADGDPAGVVTELAAGSGLYAPTLFDGYDDFTPRPAMAFALPVTRRPAPGFVTAFGGGYVASGPPGRSRLPSPVRRGLALLGAEGAGEVQTPLHGAGADALALGERVWLRGTKAGELLERFDLVHLVRGEQLVGSVPSYRGEGRNFG